MLKTLGVDSLDALIERAVPGAIRWEGTLNLPAARTEVEALEDLREIADQNEVCRSYLGMGYAGTNTPGVIQRNILENPGWYTQYTPYQAEISQGRMEALLNFQTMVLDLTGMQVANSSLLDESTAAAEAMTLCQRVLGSKAKDKSTFLVSSECHPQTIAVLQTRAEPMGIQVVLFDPATIDQGEFSLTPDTFGVLFQNPGTDGRARKLDQAIERVHEAGALAAVACDLLAMTLFRPPGEMGADIVVGTTQRFGVPMGFGGPHAAFLGAREEYKRQMPGRIIGVSIDAEGRPAMRLALSTREQHIRREKATSNICTAQVLLAIMASMYAVYHGPDGLRSIAVRVRTATLGLADSLSAAGHKVTEKDAVFDTIRVTPKGSSGADVISAARKQGINLRHFDNGDVGITLDETVEAADLDDVLRAFGVNQPLPDNVQPRPVPQDLARTSGFLEHPVFSEHHSETEMLRYLHRLQGKDLSLTTSMIPLGSCTMKLNATTEMVPVTWPEFGALHPFVPDEQAKGYRTLHKNLVDWLAEITGFHTVSLQPNAGAQGEYAGLLVIRAYLRSRKEEGDAGRDVCLIPQSAHGTNPASAQMAGMRVVVVKCDEQGNIDVADLKAKAEAHREQLAALMVTYPSTHGVFEEKIKTVCAVVHEHGGQVYMDGANMNAQVGLMKPRELGADVCHLNLHKTFCIPHGGGGPGMGPIGVAKHLAPFLPGHPVVKTGGDQAIGPVSAAPWGSPSILPISYAYIAMMGADGLRRATEVAILSANYIAARLAPHFPVLYSGQNGMVAHECILDVRGFKKSAGIEVADLAKRLIDYGFHAPTMSFPVAGTLMIEPTESEPLEEVDRFIDAMIQIRQEIAAIEAGEMDRENNALKRAPHTAAAVAGDAWDRPYSREHAAFPTAWTRAHKFWPAVARVDDVHGDRNLICACPPMEAWVEA